MQPPSRISISTSRIFLAFALFLLPAPSLHSAIVGEEPKPGDSISPEFLRLKAKAEEGSAEAALELGKLYAEGKVVFPDAEQSEKWLRKASEANLPEASHALAVFLLQTSNGGENVGRADEGLSLLRKNAETQADSALTLGQLHANGVFVSADFAESERLFNLATNLGSSGGWLWLGRLYSGEIGFPEKKDPAKVEEFLEKAVAEGNAEASRLLVKYLREGTALPKDEQRAFEITRKVAENGSSEAQYFLGSLYEEGSGTPADPGKAFDYYLSSAESGNLKAMNRLGKVYASGELGKQSDPAEARRWFSQAAEAGSPEARFRLALLLDQETSADQSEMAEVVQQLIQSATAGLPEAQDRLGSWYRDGYRLPKDLVAAAAWFRMAADSGNVAATINLAQILEANIRTTDDLNNAVELYGKAAAAGHPVAHFHLARLLHSGIAGVDASTRAHAHASKSSSAGFSAASELAATIESTLTSEQIAESSRLQESMTVLPWSGGAE